VPTILSCMGLVSELYHSNLSRSATYCSTDPRSVSGGNIASDHQSHQLHFILSPLTTLFTESNSAGQEVGVLNREPGTRSSTWSLSGPVKSGVEATCTPSSRAMQFRKLFTCYECRMIVDPDRYPIPRITICACSQRGETFPKIENSELHQAVHHAGQDPSIRTLRGVKSSQNISSMPATNLTSGFRAAMSPQASGRYPSLLHADCIIRPPAGPTATAHVRCLSNPGEETNNFYWPTSQSIILL
jgi:hypothetical protein